jgi:mRNA interferase MazF
MGCPMIKRGEVYFVSLDPAKGREQAGKRPVLVVSSDTINAQPLVVTVVAGTDSKNVTRNYPTNIRVTAAESGLPKDTVFLCFQVRSLDHARFSKPRAGRVGILPPERMAEVEDALRRALVL